MGVNAVIVSLGALTLENEAKLKAALPEGSRLNKEHLEWVADDNPNTFFARPSERITDGVLYVELCTGRRWYNGGTSGHWPTISTAIEAMRATFGNVYYGPDFETNEQILAGNPFTVEMSASLWEQWNKDQEAEHEESVLEQLEAWLLERKVPIESTTWPDCDVLAKLRELRDQ
jgi:hypothetical protein